MLARTASFCTSRSGHFDAFDQGISFFLPNMTWLQPPGHVHAMIASTRQPNALAAAVDDRRLSRAAATAAYPAVAVLPSPFLSVSAQASDDGAARVVRVVNPLAKPIGPNGTVTLELTITLGVGCSACATQALSHHDTSAANPSWAPKLISPASVPCKPADGLYEGRSRVGAPQLQFTEWTLPLTPLSYTVASFTGCSTGVYSSVS